MSQNSSVILQGDGIYLRTMTREDTELIVKWRNRDFVRRNFIYQQPFTVEGHHKWIENMIDTGKAVQFIICTDGNVPVGSTYFRDIDREIGEAEYGIFIGEEDAAGHGLGTQVTRLMLTYAFEEMKLSKIKLRFIDANQRARRSYEKAGFAIEEDLRETVHLEDGIHEVLFMACSNSAKQKDDKEG